MQNAAGTSLSPTVPSTRPRRRSFLPLIAVLAAITLVLDQGSKVWALSALAPGERHTLIGDSITLTLVRNSGAAFSIGDGKTWVMTAVAVAITVAALVVATRVRNTGWAIALGMLIGGSLGNLVDRFFRAPGPGRGHVVDFIDYFGWFVGNVADIAIVVAAGMLLMAMLRGIEPGTTPPVTDKENS